MSENLKWEAKRKYNYTKLAFPWKELSCMVLQAPTARQNENLPFVTVFFRTHL